MRDLTAGQGVAAVYDSVGQDTWRGSLKCLRRRGMFVSFGQSSGMITGFALSIWPGRLAFRQPAGFVRLYRHPRRTA